MPAFDEADAVSWFVAIEEWFAEQNVADKVLKYAAVIATQRPSIFAMVQAERFDQINADPYEIAKKFITRYHSNHPQIPSADPASEPPRRTEAPITVSSSGTPSTLPPRPGRSIHQNEDSIARQIDEIRLSIAGIRIEMATL